MDELPLPDRFWPPEVVDAGPDFSRQYLLRLCLAGDIFMIWLAEGVA